MTDLLKAITIQHKYTIMKTYKTRVSTLLVTKKFQDFYRTFLDP